MSTPRFDLVDVTQTLSKRFKTIIIISVISAVLGAAFYLISKREYKAEATFLMANPLYTDRNNIFQDKQINFVDYFAGDDDVDRLETLAESDTIKFAVAQKLNLAEAYKLDVSKPKDMNKLKNIFKDNYKVTRSEYNGCTIYYTDTDPKRAADVANESVRTIEEIFRNYYVDQRKRVVNSLQIRINDMDSTVASLTDTLAYLRGTYHIYDLISPARKAATSTSIKSDGSAGFGKALEQIQSIEALKDQLVTDRAHYTSLLNEYLTSTNTDRISLLYSVVSARVPAVPKSPGLILTTIACAMIGFFFSSLYILISTYYRLLIAVER